MRSHVSSKRKSESSVSNLRSRPFGFYNKNKLKHFFESEVKSEENVISFSWQINALFQKFTNKFVIGDRGFRIYAIFVNLFLFHFKALKRYLSIFSLREIVEKRPRKEGRLIRD